MAGRDTGRRGGWAFHPREPMAEPLDYVVQVGVAAGASPVMLHMVFTQDGLYAPAVVRMPPGRGPFPAAICLHGGSGGLGIAYLVDQMLTRGMVFDRLLAEGYLVCLTEGRMEIEEAYGTDIPAPLDHRDVIATFRHIQERPEVDPQRVAFFGVSHGGELQLKVISDLGGDPSTVLGAGPAAMVPGEPAVIEYLGLRYAGPRTEAGLQFNAPLTDGQVDLERAMERIERIPADLPILVLGRDADHLQGLFLKLHELLRRAGKRAEWASWDHPEHAYHWGPRRHDGAYAPDPTQRETLDRVMAFLNRHVRDR
jgi:acetyl esterase/lipase